VTPHLTPFVFAWDGEIPRGSERPNCPNVVFRGVSESGVRGPARSTSGSSRSPRDAAHHQFLCECADTHCVEIIELSISEYESIRSSPIPLPGQARTRL